MAEPTGFDAARSDAIRAELVDVVDKGPVRGARHLGSAIGLVLAGMLVGGGAATATAAIWDRDAAPPPGGWITVDDQGSLPGTSPGESLPGQPIVTLLGGTVVVPIEGEEQVVKLAAPDGATHVRVTITCTSPGTTRWGLDPAGNNPSVECFESDLDPGSPSPLSWMDFPLADGDAVYAQPDAGVTSILSFQYLSAVDTSWGVNADGETFGVAKPGEGDPDLLAAQGFDAAGNTVMGYVRSEELTVQCPGVEQPTSPEQALDQQEYCAHEYPHGFDVPLYASDGVTKVGTFHVG